MHFTKLEKLIENKQEEPAKTNQDISSLIQQPLEMIAASSSTTQDFLSKLTQIQSTAQEKSSNLFAKLSDKVQNMILVALSRGLLVSSSINEEAQAFFKCTNFSKAQQFLESYMEARGVECSIPTLVANLWLQGCFLWMNPLTPSGFAASVIASKDIIFNDSLHEGILLDFSTNTRLRRLH